MTNRLVALLPPLIWATFAWSYLVSLSDILFQPFYALVRGTGAVEYASAIVLPSRPVDLDLLLGAAAALLLVHLLLLGKRSVLDVVALPASAGFAIGVVGFAESSSPFFLLLLGLSSIFVVAVDLRAISETTGTAIGRTVGLLALFVVAVLAALALASGLRWVIGGFDGSVPLSGTSWSVAFVGLQLLGLLDPVLPQLALLFFFAWALRLIISPYLRTAATWARDRVSGQAAPELATSRWSGPRWSLGLLTIGCAISVFVGVYSYLPAVNPSSVLVGVDIRYYYSCLLNPVPAGSACGPIGLTLGNERIGALWLLKLLALSTGSNDLALMMAPAVLALLLTVSTYVLVLEGTGDGFTAGVSALLAAVSPQVLAGTNAAILANWLALPIAYLFFASLLHGMRVQRLVYLLPSWALFVALLFVHPWTWALALGILSVFFVSVLLQSALNHTLRSRRFEAVHLASLLLAGLASDALKSFLPSGSGLTVAYSTVSSALSLSNLLHVATNLRETFVTFLLGALADPLWFVLGTVGVLSIPTLRGRFGKLLFAWVFATSLAVVLVGPPPGTTLQARLIVDVPFQIFAAVGLVAVLNVVVGHLQDRDESGRRLANLMLALMLVAVVGLLLGFALDNVGFLYGGVPGS